jgi:hypothetical protein
MKRFLLAAVIFSSCVSPSLQAISEERVKDVNCQQETKKQDDAAVQIKKVVETGAFIIFCVAASASMGAAWWDKSHQNSVILKSIAPAGFFAFFSIIACNVIRAGLYPTKEEICAQKKAQFLSLFESTKRVYGAIDKELLNVLDCYSAEKRDIAELASDIYLKPSCSLVIVLQALEATSKSLKTALKDIDKALTLLDEKSLMDDGIYLKNKLQSRLVLVEKLITLVHEHPLWVRQLPLYVQAEIKRIEAERRAAEAARPHKESGIPWVHLLPRTEQQLKLGLPLY